MIYVQQLNAVGQNRSGALPGSYPIWGTYAPFKYPCWATKYLIDLLLLVEPDAQREHDGRGTAGAEAGAPVTTATA